MQFERTRRAFLSGVAGIFTFWGVGSTLRAWAARLKVYAVPLAKAEPLRQVGGSVKLKLADTDVIFVRDTEATVRAINPECTHKKCLVDYKEETGKLHCRCHKSAYDLDGTVRGGPAPKPLTTYRTKLDLGDDRVLIKLPVGGNEDGA